jgi:hypothetical protein
MTELAAADVHIERYVDEIAARLDAPARARTEILDELRDGLHAATESRLATRVPAAVAARDAIEEFGAAGTVAAALQADLLAARARAIARRMFATGPVLGLLWIATLGPPLLARHGRPGAVTVAVAVMLAAAAASLTAATLTLQGPRLLPLRRAAWLERIAPTTIAIATTATILIDTAALSALVLTLRAEAIPPSAVAISAAAGVASTIRLPLAARAAGWAWRHRTRGRGFSPRC